MILTIQSVEQKTGKNGAYYSIQTDKGKFSSNLDVRPFIGKTADFVTGESLDKKYKYINKELPAVPAPSVQGQSSPGLPKENTMILAYAKDLTVSGINSGQIDGSSVEKVCDHVLAIYKRLIEGVEAYEAERVPF